jgi:hypothetical protein
MEAAATIVFMVWPRASIIPPVPRARHNRTATVFRTGGCGVRDLKYCNASYPRRLWTSSATLFNFLSHRMCCCGYLRAVGKRKKYRHVDYGKSLHLIQLCTCTDRHLAENVSCFLTILYTYLSNFKQFH